MSDNLVSTHNNNDINNITDRSDFKDQTSIASSRSSVASSTSLKSITNIGTNGNKVITEKLSPIHENILYILKHSTVLSPIYINVKNESYWYIQRNKIGPKKHMALLVKYNDNKCEYEANIFKMKLRESDMEVLLLEVY